MVSNLITVRFTSNGYVYKHEYTDILGHKHNKRGGCSHHVNNGDTISWVSPDGDLTIAFAPGNSPITPPSFTTPQGVASTPLSLSGRKGQAFKYDATVAPNPTDDPMIIFDDGLIMDVSVGVADLKTIANQTAESLGAFMAKLSTPEGAPQHDPKALFFPHGITSIAVTLTIGPATVGVTVTGPDSGNRDNS